ncbi:putative Lysine exporter LysO [Burkholderia multivorans]
MQTLLTAVTPILVALIAGFLVGRCLPTATRTLLVRFITPLVWVLLLSIGHQFGNVLSRGTGVRHAVGLALLFAFLTTAVPWLLIVLTTSKTKQPNISRILNFGTILKPLRECAIALLAVAIGVATSLISFSDSLENMPFPSSNQFLYLLIGLVGMDMVGISVSRSWLSAKTLAIPFVVVIGSLLGGLLASAIGRQPMSIALALSSGFGWFTLSGALVASHIGDMYGTIALLTDLFRELLAIVLLYSVGARFSDSCIAASGATALDSTLPIIKQICKPIEIPTAIVSGLILTLAAPFLITIFLMH